MPAAVGWLAPCDHDADDLVQETWLATMRWPVPVSASPRAWLATVLRRTAAKRRTAGQRRMRREERAARPARARSTAELAAAAETHARVVAALIRLPEPYRATLLLRFYEDLPPRTIAQRMGVPVETVRSRVRRGLQRLRARLDEDGRLAPVLAPLLVPARRFGRITAAASALILTTMLSISFGDEPAPRFEARRDVAVPVFQDDPALDEPAPAPAPAPTRDGTKIEKKKKPVPGIEVEGGGELRLVAGPQWLPDEPAPGASVLEGVVVDKHGRPLAGATVYRLKPGLARGIHHFGKMTKLGVTDEEGRFTFGNQAAGGFWLTADYGHALTLTAPPWGLNTDPAIAVTLGESATVNGLRITLPVDRARTGAVVGRVVDDEGKPLAHEFVSVGAHRVKTDADGRFRASPVLAGRHAVTTAPLGYKARRTAVDVKAKETATATLALHLAESGKGSIEGRIFDRDGQPIAGRRVYLNDRSDHESVRVTHSGADGRYRFARLSERLAGHDLEVQAAHSPESPWFGRRRAGLAIGDRGIDLILDRATWVRLDVVSAQDGTPFTQTRGMVYRETQGKWVIARQFHVHVKPGGDRFRALAGSFRITVEAPGHVEKTVTVEIPEKDEHVVRIELDPMD